jgi:hypothetical protein
MQRDWTQHDIVEETRKRHRGPGFFNTLHTVTSEAFADLQIGDLADLADWQFSKESPTIGQIADFFAEGGRRRRPNLRWHNEPGGPGACIAIINCELAEAFRDRFSIKWLSRDEAAAAAQEEYVRATSTS